MKNWFTTNMGLKILSVFFAVGLWMIVVNIDDPVTTKTFKNIPVVFENETVLSDAGLVYQVLDGSNSVSFTVRAKRSIVESLTNSDFKAVADFSERISETSVPVKVYALKNEDKILDINLQKNTVKISIEEEIVKKVPVNLQVTGNTAEGHTVGDTTVSPSEITVSGPQSLVDDIASMEVVLDASNASEDISTQIEGQLFDKNGDEVDDERLYCSTTKFDIKAKLLHTKSVDLDFSVEGTVKDGYRYTEMHYSPTTVLLAGNVDDLKEISTIVIPASELNIDGADKDIEKTVDVSKYLPENLKLVNDSDKKVKVTIKVEELTIQKVSFPVTKVDVLNTPTGLDASFDGNLYLDIQLRGQSQDFLDFSVDNLGVSVDLKGLSEGKHKVKTEITTNNNDIEVVDEPTVEVNLSATTQTSQTVESSPAPTSTPAATQDNSVSDTSGTGSDQN